MEMLRTWVEWTLSICSVPIAWISGCSWMSEVRPVTGHVLSRTKYLVLDKLSYVELTCLCNLVNCLVSRIELFV